MHNWRPRTIPRVAPLESNLIQCNPMHNWRPHVIPLAAPLNNSLMQCNSMHNWQPCAMPLVASLDKTRSQRTFAQQSDAQLATPRDSPGGAAEQLTHAMQTDASADSVGCQLVDKRWTRT